MKVPLVDLGAGYAPIREALQGRFEQILEGMQLFLGPETRGLEREFARYSEVSEGIAVSSGSDALLAALWACGIGPGDEVICPSLTFFATIEAVARVGATPVLVDVESDSLTLDPERVRAAITPATKALLPVHLHGHPADMESLAEIARHSDLQLIEDAAQAHGARQRGQRCGSMGRAGCFSFYYTKNLGAFGEGGFVATDDADVAERIRRLRDHGQSTKGRHELIGWNLRMDELQAAVLRLKLPRLDTGNARRRELADRYRDRLAGAPIELPVERADCESVYHVFAIRSSRRDALRRHLQAQGIGTGIHYGVAAHEQPALQSYPHRCFEMDVTERATRELLSLPMYPELSDDQVDTVCGHVRRFFEQDATQ